MGSICCLSCIVQVYFEAQLASIIILKYLLIDFGATTESSIHILIFSATDSPPSPVWPFVTMIWCHEWFHFHDSTPTASSSVKPINDASSDTWKWSIPQYRRKRTQATLGNAITSCSSYRIITRSNFHPRTVRELPPSLHSSLEWFVRTGFELVRNSWS